MAQAALFSQRVDISLLYQYLMLPPRTGRHSSLAVRPADTRSPAAAGIGHFAGRAAWARSTSAHGSRASKTRRCSPGGASSSTTSSLPGTLHAAFVRSPHGHARIRGIDSAAARAMPGVHAVLTADDMPPRIATGQIPMLVPNPAIRTPRTQIALARDEVCYVGQTVAVVVADSRASRRGRGRGRRDRLRAAAGGERRPRRGEARRGARARRSRLATSRPSCR